MSCVVMHSGSLSPERPVKINSLAWQLDLYIYDLIPQFGEINGILDMNFLKDHVVYIDYKDKFIYIGDHNVD